MCLYLTFATIEISRGEMHGLSAWFLPTMLLMIVATISFFIYRGYKRK